MSTATPFGTIKAAKDYLVEKIVAEAARQGVPLSNVEREMLYWTEDDLLSPHMLQVAEELERECSDHEYEAKIGSFVQGLQSHLTREERDLWDEAVLKLCEGDHYLLVLIDEAGPKQPLIQLPEGLQRWLPDFDHENRRPAGDLRRLILAALIISVVILGTIFLFARR